MTSQSNDLTPTDRLCNVFVEFAGLDRHLGSADADIRFRFTRLDDGHERVLTELSFPVAMEGDGFSGQVARGHDALIAMLRQALFLADKMRTYYRNAAKK